MSIVYRKSGKRAKPTGSYSNRKTRKVYRSKLSYQTISKQVGFSESMRTKLVYFASIPFTNATNTQIFRGNSVFDPDLSGGGAQPNYYDTYASVYSTYRVHSSSIEVNFNNASPTVTGRCYVMPSDVVTTPTNVPNAIGNPYVKWKSYSTNNAGHSIQKIKHRMTTAKINGKTQAQVKDSDNYQALINANPADTWYWFVGGEDCAQTSAQSMFVDVKLTYDVEFTDKLNQNLN